MAVGLFDAAEKHMCEHASRVHPLYFHYRVRKSGRHDDRAAARVAGEQPAETRKPGCKGVAVHHESRKTTKGHCTLNGVMKSDLIMSGPEILPGTAQVL